MTSLPQKKEAARHLEVDWSDREWTPRVIVGPAAYAAGVWFERPRRLLSRLPRLGFSCRNPLSILPKSMNKTPCRFGRARRGFTLIEMLVVISIIAILAGLLLPVFAKVKLKARIAQAKNEMQGLTASFNQYDTAYSRYPNPNPGVITDDYTFGYPYGPTANSTTTNADVMVILTALDTGLTGINQHNAKNPQKLNLYNGKSAGDTNSAGLSTIDNQLRDPWGHPYVISIDFGGDGYCKDVMYSLGAVHTSASPPSPVNGKGLVGLVDYGGSNTFLLHAPIMIWSLGPDGKADNPAGPANAGFNLDNILSWQ
jgi:prepilin-type N-terminal cleavage/methylation domain-containing protein